MCDVINNNATAILQFSEGLLTNEEAVLLFTQLIKTGAIWKLSPAFLNVAIQHSDFILKNEERKHVH